MKPTRLFAGLMVVLAALSIPILPQLFGQSVVIEGQHVTPRAAKEISDLFRSPTPVTDAATISINFDAVNTYLFTVTFAGNRTFDFVGHKAGRVFRVHIKQDATGSRLATWDADVRWPGGTAPTLTTTAARTDCFEFYDNGAQYLGRTLGLNYNES